MTIQEMMLEQIAAIHGEFVGLRAKSQYDDISDLPEAKVIRFNARARALIHRIAPPPSVYSKHCEEIVKDGGYSGYVARQLFGVVDSLKADAEAGFLRSQSELIHGELFADFLEMAQHLLDEGYKDAAAVIAGSSLEAHLRRLATKSSIALDQTVSGSVPKKADRLAADLAGAGAISKLDQKNIIAWLDLRNKAAHGEYGKYEHGQVSLLISGIRDFIARSPA